MTIPDYTLVIGVDAKHLNQLAWVWPTWCKHKPSLLDHPMIVFYDRESDINAAAVRAVAPHPNLNTVPWPPEGITYSGDRSDRWSSPQRYKMLAGFVHVAAYCVDTAYWLKLDTDVIATGMDDWIDPGWFADAPAIVSAPWSFTKPPDQMMKLDQWVRQHELTKLLPDDLSASEPLNLIPKPGASRIGHKRIISWCAFFRTDFTRNCARMAHGTCGPYQLPVPSQDGFVWYVAKRLGLGIVRSGMKRRGWVHRMTEANIRKVVEEAMSDGQ